MKRDYGKTMRCWWQLVCVYVALAVARFHLRHVQRRNRKLRARLQRLETYERCRAKPLVKIGPGGDYVREFHKGGLN